jgi:hypothetical protein
MTNSKREAFRIIGTEKETGRVILAASSATREAAEKRAGQWTRNRSMAFYAPYRVVTDAEYQAARA